MLKWHRADLHIHTCLSPCGEIVMSPRRVVAEARTRGLDLIAVTDHNSAENASAVLRAAEGNPAVLPGMEVCSSEDVHVLALFDSLEPALALQEEVYRGITSANDPERFGLQVIANEQDEVEGFQAKLLIGATDMSIDQVVRRVHELKGLAIASHVDRESFGILGHLGFIPHGLRFDALEISDAAPPEEVRRLAREYATYRFIRSSDAHTPERIGSCTTRFLIEEASCGELKMAFEGEGGRRVAEENEGAG
jgi:PHP family Zn ribbon phosphoesterase